MVIDIDLRRPRRRRQYDTDVHSGVTKIQAAGRLDLKAVAERSAWEDAFVRSASRCSVALAFNAFARSVHLHARALSSNLFMQVQQQKRAQCSYLKDSPAYTLRKDFTV